MSALITPLEELLKAKPFRLVLSGPNNKNADLTRITIEELAEFFQGEKQINNQVFHDNIPKDELFFYLQDYLDEDFTQLHAFDGQWEYRLRITKKGKVLSNKQKHPLDVPQLIHHNRKKDYILEEGTIIPPLIDMGIFTKSGKIIPSMSDKYKQINQFIQVIDHAVSLYSAKELTVIDFGCGKSYLTFLLYYYLTEVKDINTTMIGLDLKKEVIENCNLAAKKYGYQGLSFQLGDIADFKPTSSVDMVVTLHACDTATDYALHHAINWDAEMIFSVPCCQQEVNQQIKTEHYGLFTRYGLVKERFASLMTDAIRGNLLTACGYRTQLVEFVDWENTPKNTLIRSVKTTISKEQKTLALKEVHQVIEEFHVAPTLYRLLQESEKIT